MASEVAVAHIHARATIAAALIQSKAVDVSGVNWDTSQPMADRNMTILKTAVDKVMIAIGLSAG